MPQTIPEVRWLDQDQQKVWRTYLLATNLFAQRLNEDLRELDLDLSEYEVLVVLSECETRSMRMSELAEKVHQSRSRLTHTVSRMERAGLILRQDSTEDRRGVLARMTDYGYERLVAAAPTHVMGVREYLVDAVSPEDYVVLGRAMGCVLKAVQKGL